jgi:excinuclease ABC subunit C
VEAKPESLTEQRKQLPDQPGVYMFKDAEGGVLYVGKAMSIRKRVASHFSGPHRGGLDFIGRVASIDFLVTETEAEALLAEQQFIKRHRPKFNIRLRDDKSYPYIGVSLDEEFPRVYFTRERHRSGRVYFGPFSSARRVRETLDLLGKLFQYRTCEGPEPGRRSGVPCLDYYIKRCQAPCVGYIDREEYRRNIEAIVDFLSGRYRDVERDLERKMAEASDAEEFERAATYRDRLEAVRSLMQRRSVAGESLETADLIAVAVEGTGANAQVFQVRDGVLAERQGFYLANEAERAESEVTEEFIAQYYSAVPAVPRLVVVGPALEDRVDVLAEALSTRRGGPVEVRVSERRKRWTWTRFRSGSRASTSPTSVPTTRWRRWWCSRAGRPRSRTTGASGFVGTARRALMTSRRSRRCSDAGRHSSSSRPTAHPTTPSATRALLRSPT